jgi:hypothetical protein
MIEIAHCVKAERTEVEKSLKLGTPPGAATPPQLQVNKCKICLLCLF